MIYVTHDQVEAMTMADRIVVLNEGRHRAGRARRSISTTIRRNRFVAGFIGSPTMNFLDGKVVRTTDTDVEVELNGGRKTIVRCRPVETWKARP